MIRLSIIMMICLSFLRCTPQVIKASTRNPDLFEKPGSSLNVRAQDSLAANAPSLYVRKPEPVIKPSPGPNESGSLMNLDDERNYLFQSAGPHKVGRFVNVMINSNVKPEKKEKEAENAKNAPPKDEIEKELLSAIPDLIPANPENTKLMESFKMKILHRYQNGDVMALMNRQSLNGEDAEELNISARIPYERLMAGEPITTDDLQDVKMVSSSRGEVLERRSSGWQDEYSLRMSGFDEVNSKFAADIDDKTKKLESAKNNLTERVKSFGKEREQFAKQREELNRDRAKIDDERKALNSTIEKQNEALKTKDEQISALEQKAKDSVKKEEAPQVAN